MTTPPVNRGDGLHPSYEFYFVHGMVEHAHQQQDLFRIVLGKRSGYFVHTCFRDLIVRLVKEELRPCKAEESRIEATAHYIGGAFVELLAWWLEARKPLSAKRIETLFNNLTAPIIADLFDV